eukprot:1316613-Pyramimonas_sp.AAC.1
MIACTIGRTYHAAAPRRKFDPRQPEEWIHGGLQKPRREAAMGVQLISSYRLQAAGISRVVRFYDATDAFFSHYHGRCFDILPTLYANQ